MSDREIVKRHLEALRAEAREAAMPDDVLARLLVQEAVGLWQRDRSPEDIARELQFVVESLDPDTEFTFMRP